MPIQYDQLGNVIQGTEGSLGGSSGIDINQQAAARIKRQGATPFGERDVPGVPDGAEPVELPEVETAYLNADGVNESTSEESMRVRIRVPGKYLVDSTSGPDDQLANLGGIIFPFTPSISFDVKADYTSSNPLHSNFPINFYQRSSIGSISISGKFSVENWVDAGMYLSTIKLLKALTRMRSGGSTGDFDSGAPPPICRLDAYGEFMLKNVPVAITSFRVELPDSVDYFIYDSKYYGKASVPVMSTIAVTCLPMYSRSEMQEFSVTGYLSGALAGRGFI